MADRVRYRPFTGDTTTKVRLKEPPLELVLCQIRWPEMTHLQGEMKPVALQLGASLEGYPVYSELQEIGYTITPEGVQMTPGGSVFQWQSIDTNWHVSLGRRFISLYCTRYGGYEEFNRRLVQVLEAVASTVRIQLVDRVAIRYVNRIADPKLIDNLAEYVEPAVLGYSAIAVDSAEVAIVSSANQAKYAVGDEVLQVRTGLVPPGETVDPAVKPLAAVSWIMDFDASSERLAPFDSEAIVATAGKLSDVVYDYFRMVTTQGFIREFGGEV